VCLYVFRYVHVVQPSLQSRIRFGGDGSCKTLVALIRLTVSLRFPPHPQVDIHLQQRSTGDLVSVPCTAEPLDTSAIYHQHCVRPDEMRNEPQRRLARTTFILWYFTLLSTAGMTIMFTFSVLFGVMLPVHVVHVQAARQPYDVRKIIDAFRTPHDDLKLLCAHRGLRYQTLNN